MRILPPQSPTKGLTTPLPYSENIRNVFQNSIKTALFTAFLTCGNMFHPIDPAYAISYPRPVIDQVERVVDGDTLILQTAGRVRMIGMNTPETVAPAQRQGAPPQCFGPEASAYTKSMLPSGTKVRLELDQEQVDRYDRKLAYVFREKDETFINAELVKNGYARAKTYGKNDRYESLLKDYESEAKTNKRGLWGECLEKKATIEVESSPLPYTKDKPIQVSEIIPNPGDTKNCADFETYEEAKKWYDKYFPLYGDIAKLDGNNDGIPCESLQIKRSK